MSFAKLFGKIEEAGSNILQSGCPSDNSPEGQEKILLGVRRREITKAIVSIVALAAVLSVTAISCPMVMKLLTLLSCNLAPA